MSQNIPDPIRIGNFYPPQVLNVEKNKWEILTGSDGAYKAQSIQTVSADYIEGTGNMSKEFAEDMQGISIYNDSDAIMRFVVNGVSRPVFPKGTYQQIFKEAFRSISIIATGKWYIDVLQQLGASVAVVTPEPPDTTAPDNVTDLAYSNVTQNSVTLTWTASASADTVGYEIWRGGSLLATVTGTTYNATGLTAETQYTFTVKAKDDAGNVASGTSINVTTAAQPSDTTPPNNVTGLTAGVPTQNSVNLSWQASASSDVKDYRIYNGAALIATVTGLSYNVTGLTASTACTFTVKARDNANNEASGASIDVTTAAPADTTPPVMTISPNGGTFDVAQTVTITSNEPGPIYYTTNGIDPTESDTHYSVPITISANTTLKARAKDAAGNWSTVVMASFTITVPDTTPPDPVSGLTAGTPTSNSIPLTWTLSPSSDVTAQEVAYSTDGSSFTVASGSVNPSSTSYTVQGLAAETQYTLRVVAIDGAGNRSTAVTVQVTTATEVIPSVPVESISLNKVSVTLEKNQATQLIATVLPSNADNKDVSWSSSNESIATVSTAGLVKCVGVGTATITATTGDKTSKCSVSVIAAVIGFDYNNLSAYPDDSTITFDQVVNGENDWVHPSVLYFEEGWNGHKYWMGINPYPNTQGSWENPFLFYSDNGDNWFTPVGLTQPIHPKEADVGNNSDSHIFMDYDGVTMHYLNRGALSAGGSMTEIFSTTDGKTFTDRQRILTSPEYPDYVSPSVCRVDGKYYMFATDVTNLNVLCVLEATDAKGTWTEINRIATGTLGAMWHVEVRYINQEFILVGSTGYISGGDLVLGKFHSVMDATMEGRNNSFIIPPKTQPYNQAIYKSSLVVKNQEEIEVFIGFKGGALDATTDWCVTRVQCERIPQTLDFASRGYVEVESYADSGTFNHVNHILATSTDYAKYAMEATVTSAASYPIAFASSTSQNAVMYLTNTTPKRLVAEAWGINPTRTKQLSYGWQVGDRVTMILEDDLEFYVNGRLLHKETAVANLFDRKGLSFGDKSSGLLTDIKIYKKSEYIYSTSNADAFKAQLLDEYATTPNSFIMVDEFNRTNGAVGVSTNGVTWEVVGSPIIENNALKPNGNDTNAALVPASGNYQVLFKLTAAANARFGMYLKYTDANNYVKLTLMDVAPTASEARQLQIDTRKSGVTATTFVTLLGDQYMNHFNWRIDVIDEIAHVYWDAVYVGKFTIPNEAFEEKIGFTSGYNATLYDYVIVKQL